MALEFYRIGKVLNRNVCIFSFLLVILFSLILEKKYYSAENLFLLTLYWSLHQSVFSARCFSKSISILLSSINQAGKKNVAIPHKNGCPLLRHSMRNSHCYGANKIKSRHHFLYNVWWLDLLIKNINRFLWFINCCYCQWLFSFFLLSITYLPNVDDLLTVSLLNVCFSITKCFSHVDDMSTTFLNMPNDCVSVGI